MKFILLLILFTGSVASCEQVVVNDQEITAENLEKKLAEIRSMIDVDSCSETDQCRFLAYGSKACGGPQGYLLFSNQIDVEALTQKVEEYNRAEDAYNKKFGIISDCMFVTPPEKLTCENGKCVPVE
jgi:hypothetical protein